MAPTPLARLVASSGLSNLADGVFQVALPLVALGVTRDPGAFGAVTLVGRLPWLLVALPAGALADRLDRRRTMARVNLLRAALIGGLAALVATDHHELWALYVVSFALGVAETMFDTAAQSVLPAVVGSGDLSRANSRLYAVELTANQFVGPPLGGLLVAASATAALAGSAAAYVLAALALATLAGDFRPRRTGPPTRLRTDIAEGVRYLAGNRVLRTLAACVGLANLAFTAAYAVLPLHAVDPGPMGLSEAGYGLLLTTVAIGSVAVTGLPHRLEHRFGRTRVLIGTQVLFPVAPLALALTDSVAWAGLGLLTLGATNMVWNVLTVSMRQRIVPDRLLGRVNAGYRLVAWGTMPLGAALGAVVGEVAGVRSVFWLSVGLGALVIPTLLAGVSDRAIAEAEREAEAAAREAGAVDDLVG